ncbi:thiamine pyrophosphokinase [Terfezia boudieri ATCC MYA-4762]|uniref:Thiamine pyrophosphokinase n=1 Tax=Terfezia boudieri ATCC MYA-4762 TaxID=1051890 RepID=A0A3N4LKD4_9PEZI|nr:thiamine pyrophosphokinase [Terfezia boudieri ATCC MYA-4762]
MPTSTDQIALWDPSSFRNQPHGYVLLLLNQQIKDITFLKYLWTNAKFRVCGDGGGNQLYDALDEKQRGAYTPNAICGDLDSLRPEVQEYYASVGVDVVHDPDQDSTDFGKCLDYIQKHYRPSIPGKLVDHVTIFVYNALGGRMDHAFHSIHQLHLAISQQRRKIFLLSEEGITFLLVKGENQISLPKEVFGPACGIIPVGGPSVITTKGLVWDVTDWETTFGGKVSTSNVLNEEVVTVFTTEPVLFTVEIKAAVF